MELGCDVQSLLDAVEPPLLGPRQSAPLHRTKRVRVRRISLPKWVLEIGDKNPDIYYTDKSGHRNKVCWAASVQGRKQARWILRSGVAPDS